MRGLSFRRRSQTWTLSLSSPPLCLGFHLLTPQPAALRFMCLQFATLIGVLGMFKNVTWSSFFFYQLALVSKIHHPFIAITY